MPPRENKASVKIYFTDFFGVHPEILEQYGALNISLVSDLPLFIDPFLLFNSTKPEYLALHDSIINYLRFLREVSTSSDRINKGLLRHLFVFSEVKQNLLGYSKIGNRGSGLGPDFARALHSNLNRIFSDFGKESVTKSSHLEKICLIKDKVGRDNISDFTTNLIKEYLLGYTQTFTQLHLGHEQRKTFAIKRVRFSYDTRTWVPQRYDLPCYNGNYVILTPKDMLTKDETWINKSDLVESFDDIADSIPNEQIRAQLDFYLMTKLPKDKEPTKKERLSAISSAILQHPEVIDYYIRYKEDRGDDAIDISKEKVILTETQFIDQVQAFVGRHLARSSFYYLDPDNPHDVLDRLLILKDIIENEHGSNLLYIKGNAVKREVELQLLLSILWRASFTAITGRGGRGAIPVHFKLASNTKLARILEQRKDATASGQPFPPIAIISFTRSDLELAIRHVNALALVDDPGIVFIDASGKTIQAPGQEVAKLIKILFLAASPENEVWLRVDKEMREIRNRVRSSTYRDQFDISDEWAVRAVDLQEHLLRHNPTIVHFSGHGSSSGELVLEDLNGLSHPVEVDALRALFSLLGNSIKCVVLNACFSETQARAIAETVDCVVGMSDTIGDDSAIAFASSFYQALGYGKSIKSAFDLGCNQIHISALNDQDIPKLIIRSRGDPANVFLLQSP